MRFSSDTVRTMVNIATATAFTFGSDLLGKNRSNIVVVEATTSTTTTSTSTSSTFLVPEQEEHKKEDNEDKIGFDESNSDIIDNKIFNGMKLKNQDEDDEGGYVDDEKENDDKEGYNDEVEYDKKR